MIKGIIANTKSEVFVLEFKVATLVDQSIHQQLNKLVNRWGEKKAKTPPRVSKQRFQGALSRSYLENRSRVEGCHSAGSPSPGSGAAISADLGAPTGTFMRKIWGGADPFKQQQWAGLRRFKGPCLVLSDNRYPLPQLIFRVIEDSHHPDLLTNESNATMWDTYQWNPQRRGQRPAEAGGGQVQCVRLQCGKSWIIRPSFVPAHQKADKCEQSPSHSTWRQTSSSSVSLSSTSNVQHFDSEHAVSRLLVDWLYTQTPRSFA